MDNFHSSGNGRLPKSMLEVHGNHTETRSEEHTSELQSQSNLVCRLLLEKKKKEIQSSESLAHRRAPTQRASPNPPVRKPPGRPLRGAGRHCRWRTAVWSTSLRSTQYVSG